MIHLQAFLNTMVCLPTFRSINGQGNWDDHDCVRPIISIFWHWGIDRTLTIRITQGSVSREEGMALGKQPTGSAPKQSKIKQRSSEHAGSLLEMQVLRPHPRPTAWGLIICVLARPPGDSGASQVWGPLERSWEKLSNEASAFSDVTEMCSSFKLFYWVFRALCSFAPSPFLTFITPPPSPTPRHNLGQGHTCLLPISLVCHAPLRPQLNSHSLECPPFPFLSACGILFFCK